MIYQMTYRIRQMHDYNSSLYSVITEYQFRACLKKKQETLRGKKYKAHHIRCQLYIIMLPARKVVSNKTLMEEYSSETIGLRLLLIVDLMNQDYLVKKIQWKFGNIIKNGHREDDTHFTLLKILKLKILRVILIMKVLPSN